MGALFVAWMVLAALPPPPVDDGTACQHWAVDAAEALLQAPQPPASPLDGKSSGGLSEIPDEVWVALGALGYPSKSDAGTVSWREVKEGTAPISSVPAIERALVDADQPLRRVLLAARGPSSTLSDPWQVWCVLDCSGLPSIERARVDVPTLSLAFGWRALEQGRVEDAVLGCLGLAGFLRALGGTHLLGQMLSASFARNLSLLCIETARRVSPNTRRQLAANLDVVEREWPAFSHTMRQELVFGQMISQARLPPELRSRVPSKWRAIGRTVDDASWTTSLREKLFGGWALRERCLAAAALVEVSDAAPRDADARFGVAAAPTLLSRLAWEDASPSNWTGYVRRVRRLRTELRMLVVSLREASVGRVCEVVDARTGRPLEIRGSGADRVVVAIADPAFGAEELHLPVPEGRPTVP